MRLSARRKQIAGPAIVAILVAILAALPVHVANASTSWQYTRTGLAPLLNPTQWILRGAKQPNGACRYSYPTGSAVVPASGWIVRSIAIDVDGCRKLFEQGTPTAFSTDRSDSTALVTDSQSGTSSGPVVVASTKSAWQRVIWRDIFGILTNAVMVQVNWTYNGSTVSGGSTNGAWQLNTATEWKLDAKSLSQLYGPGSSYYRGQGTATFSNSQFCHPLPVVHTYYYYVRMWGHPNGTATRDQSSDSVDECIALHVDIESAYGQWPG
jgi:hypothetical protein